MTVCSAESSVSIRFSCHIGNKRLNRTYQDLESDANVTDSRRVKEEFHYFHENYHEFVFFVRLALFKIPKPFHRIPPLSVESSRAMYELNSCYSISSHNGIGLAWPLIWICCYYYNIRGYSAMEFARPSKWSALGDQNIISQGLGQCTSQFKLSPASPKGSDSENLW